MDSSNSSISLPRVTASIDEHSAAGAVGVKPSAGRSLFEIGNASGAPTHERRRPLPVEISFANEGVGWKIAR